MAFIEAKAIKVYYTKGDRKPYDINGKPLSYLGQDNIGANIATQVRFYLGEEFGAGITPIVVSKRADGERHFDILQLGNDEEVEPNQKFYYVNLSNWYSEKVGKLTMALKVYSGTVVIEGGEIVSSTGRIVVSDIFHVDIAYAPDASDLVPPFDPDYYAELLEALAEKADRQEVIQVVNVLPTVSTDDNGKWFLVRQTNGGRLYRVLGGVAVEVETEMGKLKLTPTGNGELTTNTGRVAWSQPNGTLELGVYNDVVLHLGEDSVYYGKATATIVKGDIIQFAGYQGDHALIKPAVPSEINANAKLIMGIAKQNIANNEFGYVSAFGKIEQIDTKGLNAGNFIWFNSASGSNGQWTNVMPTAPNAKVLVGAILKKESSIPANNGVILVRPTMEPKLNDLQDVNLVGSTTNDVLRYNGSVWTNSNELTTAEGEIDQLQTDVLGLDNTKADITYVDSQDTALENRIDFIETNGGIDFIKVANFDSLPTSGDVRNHRLFLTIDTNKLYEFDGTSFNEVRQDKLTADSGEENGSVVASNGVQITYEGGADATALKVFQLSEEGDGNVLEAHNTDGLQFAVNKDGSVNAYGDLTIAGNLTVSGTTTTVNTAVLDVEDNIITINKNQTGTPETTLLSGIEVERGAETNFQFVFQESSDLFKVGQVGDLQAVATREDTPTNNGIAYFNTTTNKFETNANITYNSSLSRLFVPNVFANIYSNPSSGNNSFIETGTTGTLIFRNVNDANSALRVNQQNASSTGNITNFQWQGTNRLEITRNGFLTQNGTRLFTQPVDTTNTFFGNTSGGSNTTGTFNTAFGSSALRDLTSGLTNTAIGVNSLLVLTTGSDNTAIGTSSGTSITTGGSNTFIGRSAGFNASQLVSATNSTAIGNGSYTDASNQMVFGNAIVTQFKFDRNTSAVLLAPTITASSGADNSFERTSSFSNAIVNNLILRHTTSADMVDGTGAGVLFQIRDTANISNSVGRLGVVRSGADNSGRFTFETSNAGSFTEKMTIMPNGNVGIGTSSPAGIFSVLGTGARINANGANGSGVNNSLRLGGGDLRTANDATQLILSQNVGSGWYNSAIRLTTTETSPSFLNPRMEFLLQNTGTFQESDMVSRMTILSNGRVGIGTTAPGHLLHVNSASNGGVAEFGAVSARLVVGADGNGAFLRPVSIDTINFLRSNSTNAMTIKDGQVGINETSPSAQLQVKSGSTTRVPLIVDTQPSNTAALQIWRIAGADFAFVDNGGNFRSNRLSNGGGLDNSTVNTATTGTTISRNIADANVALKVNQVHASSTGDIQQWYGNNAFRAYVDINGDFYNASGTYGQISDVRVKENIVEARNYLEDLMKLRVVKYSLKDEKATEPTKLGFIAQEFEQVFPSMVSTSEQGEIKDFKSIKLSVLIPMLVKTIQELKKEIDELKK